MDEKNVIILIEEHIPCLMLKKLTSQHTLEMSTILHHTYMDAALLFIDDTSQYCAVNLPDFIGNVHFQCINFAWFVTEQPFLKVAPQKRNQEGLSQVVVEATDPQTSVNPLRNSGSSTFSLLTCGISHHLVRCNLESVTRQDRPQKRAPAICTARYSFCVKVTDTQVIA